MKRVIRTIVIVIVFLIVEFIPYRYKKNDFDVIKSNNMESDVSVSLTTVLTTISFRKNEINGLTRSIMTCFLV